MNIFTFDGHLGGDAETRFTQNGTAVCSFSVPAKSGFGDNVKTTWVKCSLWGKRAESLGDWLVKGTKVVVSGEMSLDEWQSNDGRSGTTVECNVNDVVIMSNRDQANKPSQSSGYKPKARKSAAPVQQAPEVQKEMDDDFDDDIPFN